MADEKKNLRSILRRSRAALDVNFVDLHSQEIQARFIGSRFYRSAANILLYSSIENEVLTSAILIHALESGKAVYFPRINRVRCEIEFARVSGGHSLKTGTYGIAEPCGGQIIAADRVVNATMCVPGLAFSRFGQRLGRGGGYYDRMIARANGAITLIGLAYSFQLLDSLPEEPNDRRMHFVVTEYAAHACSAADAGSTQRQKEVYPGGTSSRVPGNSNRGGGGIRRDPDAKAQ